MAKRTKRTVPAGILLTPGASANRDHHTLVALAEALAPLPVSRWDFPYILEGRKAPDRPHKLVASVTEGLGRLAREANTHPANLLAGGRSMGGRMCSVAAAEAVRVAGLVLISYPLHPPGKPEKLRVDHFPALDVPCLFVSGTRDAFGTPDELESHTAAIPGPVTHVWIEGGDHGLKRHDEAVTAAVTEWVDTTWP